jgi:CheY-like chemotaxis protein
MVIDDEDEIRLAVRRILSRDGHDVTEAETGEEGLALIENNPVDLVITDIVMPGEGGLDTVARLHRRNPGVRIIAMSALAVEELPEAERLGADRSLRKPFTAAELCKVVNEVLSAPA